MTKLKAGTYVIVVVDRSKIDNFHLKGSGINTIDKRMRAAFVGTATWRVSLSPGNAPQSNEGAGAPRD